MVIQTKYTDLLKLCLSFGEKDEVTGVELGCTAYNPDSKPAAKASRDKEQTAITGVFFVFEKN